MTIEEAIKKVEPRFKWTLQMPEDFKSMFYGAFCLTPGHYYILSSEGNERLELAGWIRKN